MFIYHGKFKNGFVYSCPGRVVLISYRSVFHYIKLKHYSTGKLLIRRKTLRINGIIKRKRPTLKYMTLVLGRIVGDRYKVFSDYTTQYDNRETILTDWEEKILVEVGFYE